MTSHDALRFRNTAVSYTDAIRSSMQTFGRVVDAYKAVSQVYISVETVSSNQFLKVDI